MNRPSEGTGWLLEVVRGRDVGHRYPLPGGTVVLGNAVGGDGQGIDLSGQEGTSPRKMAARQASVECSGSGLRLLDLDSPGGTFVNRRRLLPGQGQELKAGDVIQIGGIQLRVVESREAKGAKAGATATRPPAPAPAPAPATSTTAAPPRPRPASTPVSSPATSAGAAPKRPAATTPPPVGPGAVGPLAFSLKDGPVCRSWDDFVTISAQRWAELRDELTSGRLASYLISTGRGDLAPRADAPGSPDDRLDAWLGSLPTSRPSRPELDVHPRTLGVKASPGATTRQTFRVSNVGYRVLRSRLSVEPADAGWLIVAPEHQREFATVDETVVTLQVAAPDPFPGRLSASVVVDSNGGQARVLVVVEAPAGGLEDPFGGAEVREQGAWSPEVIGSRVASWLACRGARTRLVGGALVGIVLRLVIVVASGFSAAATLPGLAAVLAVVGGVAGGIGAWRRGGAREAPAGTFAGGFGGVMVAAVLVALCQAVEPAFGATLASQVVTVVLIWGVLGLAIGGGSLLVVPDGKAGSRADS